MSEVEVDYWENQRYRPLQGWSVPYSGGVAPFTDITGKIPFAHESVLGNSVYLPPGWEWSPDSQWGFDLSGKFGQVDPEGWSYGLSFESLIESSKQKKLRNERSTSNVVRRRRWIRVRICVSTELNAILSLKIIWVNIVREKIDEVVQNNEANYMKLTEYNAKQKKVIEGILSTADSNLDEVNGNLESLSEKLQAMKNFLIERGVIESQYSKKLESLATKWMFAGNPKQKAPTQRKSITSGTVQDTVNPMSTGAVANPSSQSGNVNSGFFYVVSTANQSIAERLNQFSALLSDSLPKDVSLITDEVTEALLDCKRDGNDIRNLITAKIKAVGTSYEVYSKCEEQSQISMLLESEQVHTQMYTAAASGTVIEGGKAMPMTTSSTSLSDMNNSVSGTNITTTGHKDTFTNVQQVDVWLAAQLYNTDLLELDSAMLQFSAFCKQQQRKTVEIGIKVGELLKSTVKAFAYEQFRVWQDSATMLDTVTNTNNSGNNSNGSGSNKLINSNGGGTSPVFRPLDNNNSSSGDNNSINNINSNNSSSDSTISSGNPLRRKSSNNMIGTHTTTNTITSNNTNSSNINGDNISTSAAAMTVAVPTNQGTAVATNSFLNNGGVNPLQRRKSVNSNNSSNNSGAGNSNNNNNTGNNNIDVDKDTANNDTNSNNNINNINDNVSSVTNNSSNTGNNNINTNNSSNKSTEVAVQQSTPSTQQEEDGNSNINIKLPYHSHLRLSNSKLLLVRAAIMQYYVIRHSDHSSNISHTHTLTHSVTNRNSGDNSNSSGIMNSSVFNTLDYSQFVTALVVLTYNRVLHIMHVNEGQTFETVLETERDLNTDTDNNSGNNSSNNSGINNKNNNSSISGSPNKSKTVNTVNSTSMQERLLIQHATHHFDRNNVLLSINLAGCAVSPVFIPKDNYRDSFEVQVPKQTTKITDTLTSLIGTATTTGNNINNSAQFKNISSVLFVTDDSIKVRNWMRSCSNPFVDPNIDSPSDFDCGSNDIEYIAMSNSSGGGGNNTTEL